MSKSSTHLGQPGSAGSKSPSLRKELQGNRSCMLRIGERLMRAGSEGNLVQKPISVRGQSQTSSSGLGQGSNGRTQPAALKDKPSECIRINSSKDPRNSPSRASSSTVGDNGTESLLQKKEHTARSLLSNPDYSYGPAPQSPNTLPRSNASSSRDSQMDNLIMQHIHVERKKEVFLDHVRQKYPQHAVFIMRHQDPMQEQVRSPHLTDSPHCAAVTGLVKEQDRLVSSNMSDGEVIPLSSPFTRGSKARASLPVGRSSGQTRERPFGVLFLQYGEETKQVWVPTEISSRDALRALFVNAFPHQLTIKMLQSPNMVIYVKDTSHNVYYDLEDIRNITPNSCLKAYHKDPAHVFNRHARSVTAGGRLSKEALYGSHSPVHTLSSSSRGTLQSLQGSMSPPMVRSMPSSPSRVAYGGGGIRGGSGGVWDPSSTLPRERLSGAGRSSTMCTSSAILERRDIKPDEDTGNSKSMALVVHGKGGPHYPDSYCSSLQDGTGGRHSIPSSQCSAPSALTSDMVDVGVLGIPGGLQQYRASIKPLMGYGESMEDQTRSLRRQKSRKYAVSQLPPMGTKTPSPSPHRVNEVRMTDGEQIIGCVGLVSPEKMSPTRRSLQQDSNSSTVEIISRSRGSGSSSSTSSVFADIPLRQSERQFQSHMNASSAQSERIKAMEEQIASLAGLVHHALSIGPNALGAKDVVSKSLECKLISNIHGVSSESQNPSALTDSFSFTPLDLQAPLSNTRTQQRLVLAKRNVCELRLQLNQLRWLQISNQETVSSMLRMAGQELVLLICDRLAQFEEAAYRRRAEMEEERNHYLAAEERILTQLSELEDYVDHLQRSSASSTNQQKVTLRDVEEGAVNLRRVGEALAILKGEFPELQMKMRSVLRQEVEAVRFLKEEPLKMDSMLKRVKALTETLSSLRRCVSESAPSPRLAQLEPLEGVETDSGLSKTQSPENSPKPQPRSSVRPPQLTPPLSGSQAEISLVDLGSPIVARRLKSTAPSVVQPNSTPRLPLTPIHGHESPTVAKVSPHSRVGSPALQRRAGLQESDGLDQPAPALVQQAHSEQTMTTERQTQEGSLSGIDSSMGQSSSCQAKQPASFHSREQQALPFGTQEGTASKQSDKVNSTDIKAPNTVPATAAASQHPAATEGLPSSPAPSAAPSERSSRPQVEKPRRFNLDKEMKQSPDRLGKSPPPPPPRRIHVVSSGIATGRSGEVVFTTRTEPVGAQDDDDKEKEWPVIPQPKPPRQPPEIKPKPQMCTSAPLAGSTSTPAAMSAERHEEKEEELQVTELTNKNHSSGGNKQNGEIKERTSLNSQVANDLATCVQQSAPWQGFTNGCCLKPIMAAGLKEHGEGGKNSLEKKVEKVIKEVPSCPTVDNMEMSPLGTLQDVQSVQQNGPTPNQDKAMKTSELPSPISQNENVNTPNQVKEFIGKVSLPTMPQKKVKFKTAVTLHKESIQESVKSPEHTNEKIVKEPKEKKSNLMAVVTLEGREKEWMSGDHLSALLPPVQQNMSLRSDQEFIISTPITKSSPFSLIMTYNSKQWKLEDTGLVSGNQLQYMEEGGSLSCDEADEGPPPPPPLCSIGKFSNRICTSRTRTQSKVENLTKINGSHIQTVSGDNTGGPTYVGHGFKDSNDESGTKPIIVILNEPVDIQSAYKRLSTIFECEENLDGILSPEGVSEEEKTKQKAEEQDLRKICITEINMGSGLTGNGQNSPQTQHERTSIDNCSFPETQDQTNSHLLRKTETKRKFKFKFPKNSLAALSQAIRTGSNKTGKKTVEVVVCEEEVTAYDRPVKVTENQTKDSPMFEMNRTEQFNFGKGNVCDRDIRIPSYTDTRHSESHSQIGELCKNTFDSMDSLEESIKQLEVNVESITAPSSSFESTDQLKRKVKQEQERSPSKRSATQITKGPNPPQSKRAKPLSPHGTERNTSKKQTSSSSSSSSAQRSHVKSRHASGSPEKTPKGQKQATQKRPSQAASRSSKAAGDSNHCVIALRASKIPALCHSSGKHPSASLSTSHCSDATDSLQNLSSSSSSASSPSPSSASSHRKHFVLSPPSNIPNCPSPSSSQRSRQQTLCPFSPSLVKNSPPVSSSDSPPCSPSPSSSSFPHKSFIPSLNLTRLLPSSSHALSPHHVNVSPAHHGPRSSSKHQHRLVFTSTTKSTSSNLSQHSCYSSSSYSSSSASSSTSSSHSPTSSSSSPPSPSSSLPPITVTQGTKSGQTSASNPSSPGCSEKRTGRRAAQVLCTAGAVAASKDTE